MLDQECVRASQSRRHHHAVVLSKTEVLRPLVLGWKRGRCRCRPTLLNAVRTFPVRAVVTPMTSQDKIASLDVRLLHGSQRQFNSSLAPAGIPNLGQHAGDLRVRVQVERSGRTKTRSHCLKKLPLLNASSVSVCTLVTCRLACSLLWFECSCTHMITKICPKLVCASSELQLDVIDGQ